MNDNAMRLFGSEMSPYSVKVRSYLRFKGARFDWIPRSAASQAEYERHAKLPIIPLVVTAQGESLQDSTPIIETLETRLPGVSIHPDDPVTGFLSALVEEFGDEWGNKWMFHYRWAREVDQVASAGRIARMRLPDAPQAEFEATAAQVRKRMVERVWFVGSSPQTAPLIERSFGDAIVQLDAHLRSRPYLFGGRPSFGDFGLWGQLYCAWTDPTPGALIEGRAPHLLDWIHRMLRPRMEGDFEPWQALAPTLMPFLAAQVGALFTPWTLANARAVRDSELQFSVALGETTWTQAPQKYHAKSLRTLRDRHAGWPASTALADVLAQSGCAPLFAPHAI